MLEPDAVIDRNQSAAASSGELGGAHCARDRARRLAISREQWNAAAAAIDAHRQQSKGLQARLPQSDDCIFVQYMVILGALGRSFDPPGFAESWTRPLVGRLIDEQHLPKHRDLACLAGCCHLVRRYGKERQEAASLIALELSTTKYMHVKAIVVNERDKTTTSGASSPHQHLSGPASCQ